MSHLSSTAVFLSYASQDAEAAQRIADALRTAGVEVWFDQSGLKGGAAWDAEIRRQIRDCALFVPIISAHTEQRLEGYFRLEWRLAEQRSHQMARGRSFLVPVVIDDTQDDDAEVPDAFVDVQWTRLPGGEGAAAFAQHVNGLLMPAEPKPAETHAAAPGHAHPLHAHPLGATASLRRPATPQRRANWPALAATAVLVGVIAGGLWYFSRGGNRAAAQAAAGSSAGQAATPVPDKSIAVLPFENLSSSADDGYLADGIADTLLQMLSQQRELKVIARTSSFTFRSSKEDVRAIGQKLGVATLLEGSVQRSGDRLRVIVQLVGTKDGSRLWSQTYDRMMADVFTVQDEIAGKVAVSLSVSLAEQVGGRGAVPKYAPPVEAYQEYLRGKQLLALASRSSVDEAVTHFRKSIDTDANYALAHVGLATALRLQIQAGHPQVLTEAVAATQRAMKLDPMSGEVWAELGWIRGIIGDQFGQEEAFRRAIELNPGSASAYQGLAGMLVIRGDDAGEARTLIEKALILDPLQAGQQRERMMIAMAEGRPDEVEQARQRWIALNPQGSDGYQFAAYVYLWRGELDQAARHFRRSIQNGGLSAAVAGWYLAKVLRTLGDASAAARLESQLPELPDPGLSRNQAANLVTQAEALLLAGDTAAAERALRRTPPTLASAANWLARLDIRSNRPRDAISRLKAAAPGLGAPSPTVEGISVALVPALALALAAAGEADRSKRLLTAAEAYLRPRQLSAGAEESPSRANVPLLLARVLALQGRRAEALAALRAGVDAGIGYAWQLWSVDEDFASIRDAPEFKACVEIVKARNARQLESLRRQPELPAT